MAKTECIVRVLAINNRREVPTLEISEFLQSSVVPDVKRVGTETMRRDDLAVVLVPNDAGNLVRTV